MGCHVEAMRLPLASFGYLFLYLVPGDQVWSSFRITGYFLRSLWPVQLPQAPYCQPAAASTQLAHSLAGSKGRTLCAPRYRRQRLVQALLLAWGCVDLAMRRGC